MMVDSNVPVCYALLSASQYIFCLTCILLFKHYSDLPSTICMLVIVAECCIGSILPFIVCLTCPSLSPRSVGNIMSADLGCGSCGCPTCLNCLPRLSAYIYWVHFVFCFLLFVSPLPPALFLVHALGLASASSNRSILDPDFYACDFLDSKNK